MYLVFSIKNHNDLLVFLQKRTFELNRIILYICEQKRLFFVKTPVFIYVIFGIIFFIQKLYT